MLFGEDLSWLRGQRERWDSKFFKEKDVNSGIFYSKGRKRWGSKHMINI
jgi:hypothetical protein